MITVVIGHRGTGKTELVKRLQFAHAAESIDFIDLDSEIEKKIGKSIMELFLEHGETYFRELERQMFLEMIQSHKNMFLVVGAGFDVSILPETVRVLWVRRQTDMEGRIFLNRPRLNPELSPIDEFVKRAKQREEKYSAVADETYLMPEGLFDNHHYIMNVEKSILLHQLHDVKGALTLLPGLKDRASRWENFKERYKDAGVELFELRDDFLAGDFVAKALEEMPDENFIFSFREVKDRSQYWESENWFKVIRKAKWFDWALELGPPDELLLRVPKEKVILSAHDSSRFEELKSYMDKVGHLKFAPEVKNFTELFAFHGWQKQDARHRSFLPRSEEGRWTWYRNLQKGQQFLNFWRDGEGSSGDQPSLFQWLMTAPNTNKFAAVLGDPVEHSFTPIEHADFFRRREMPVFAINIRRAEWNEAMPVLTKLGLRYAAVTSPHKENAAKLVQGGDLAALNTLFFDEKKEKWVGTSTDDAAFLELIDGVGMIAPLQKEIFVWGGGGTLPMIQKALPHATYFSSRTGEPRTGSEEGADLKPKILIWAAPRGTETQLPPKEWDPAMVYDLNYKEDSMGREYAQLSGANYQSGITMFIAQAQLQRSFWVKCEETP